MKEETLEKCHYKKICDSPLIYHRYKSSSYTDNYYEFTEGNIKIYAQNRVTKEHYCKVMPINQLKAVYNKAKELGWIE